MAKCQQAGDITPSHEGKTGWLHKDRMYSKLLPRVTIWIRSTVMPGLSFLNQIANTVKPSDRLLEFEAGTRLIKENVTYYRFCM